jgi:FlaA1/EpsC-like NDP-sugar epimerase
MRTSREIRAAGRRLSGVTQSQWVLRHRVFIAYGVDVAAWALALTFAALVRYDLAASRVEWIGIALGVVLVALLQMLSGTLFGLYLGRWRTASLDEVVALTASTTVVSLGLFTVDPFFTPRPLPLSVPPAAGVTALLLMAGARCVFRLLLELRRRPRGSGARRLLVFGAGEGGQEAIRAMMRDPQSPYIPIGLLDDDPRKRKLRIQGVAVLGSRDVLAETASLLRADALLIAIPTAGSTLVAELTRMAEAVTLPVKVLPSTAELLGDRISVVDIRDVSEDDLLGRRRVETDIAAVAGYITGKRVLVTGAGGSIGSELCRQLYRFGPSELIMLDRDESALHAVELSIYGRGLLDSPGLVLADIRDRLNLERLFARSRPEVVFHAAALKHLPLLERHPGEAIKTNIWGTLNLLETAAEHGVERFVNISTDKAADPISVLGYSKRICERLTAEFAHLTGSPFLSVRFGNVLGSRGSVLTTFRSQVEAGGPLTVTHPDVTRYFMTVEEAVQLVIQAGAIGRPGEALVLDMGTPVCIADVAQLLASRAPRPVQIVYTGLRPGEKLHETRFGTDEPDDRPVHPLISHVGVPPLPATAVENLEATGSHDAALAALRALSCTTPRIADEVTFER